MVVLMNGMGMDSHNMMMTIVNGVLNVIGYFVNLMQTNIEKTIL